jgi:hypothetical protein
MPNLRTFMVLKILVGEKNAASPAPPGNNSSNYASMPFPSPPLPISKKNAGVFFGKPHGKNSDSINDNQKRV